MFFVPTAHQGKAPSRGRDLMLPKQGLDQGTGWASRDPFTAGPKLNGAGGGVEGIGNSLDGSKPSNETHPRFRQGGGAAHCLPLKECRKGNFNGPGVFGIVSSLSCDLDPLNSRFLRRIEGVEQLSVHLDLVLRGRVHRFLHIQSMGTMFANVKGEF